MGLKEIIMKTEKFVHDRFNNDRSGHDWYHMVRVRNLAKKIHFLEQQGDPFIIEMAALLHDFLDEKLEPEPKLAKEELRIFFQSLSIPEKEQNHIFTIIESISFRGGNEYPLNSVEAKIVRDADRLDAMGAIGIARAFQYGGKKGSLIYDPSRQVRTALTVEEYRQKDLSTIHHFYEKLLKLKDLMLTESGKKLAEERHHFMEQFLEQFYKEWNEGMNS